MTTMKAVRIHEFGGPEGLIYEEAPRPEPEAGEVLIKVMAAGINPIDLMIGAGGFEEMVPHTLPLILGWDVAGTVEALGTGVSGFAVGDAVFAVADLRRDGAYAEYVVVSAAALCPKPTMIDFTTAAAVPLAATTAWEALFEQANLAAGQTILIHGGGGSVGGFAVQFAKAKGARVIATASAADAAYVLSLGADLVVDYKSQNFEDVAKDVDAVLDTIGGDTQARSWQTLRDGGVLVTTLAIMTDSSEAAARGVQGKAFSSHPDGAILAEI
ncbi:MAG: NADP-dependent oxidoreductase, partial [Cytophagales bacterium]|nr:NADP-dependent oxidoreductase [Armatimonadota bacterium]